MLHEINADCQVSKTNTNIKENHPCLLRHGIEVNKKQSIWTKAAIKSFKEKALLANAAMKGDQICVVLKAN